MLLDSAYDMSLRDLRDNWLPIAGLVVCAVGLTTAGVAVVAHALAPSLPWAAAIALGAVVAPPDAVAATAVLRQLDPPHRIVTILEGESLLNDATALLIYRIALGAVAAGEFTWHAVGPLFLLGVAGSLLAGAVLGQLALLLMQRIRHVPSAIILQFVCTFGVWVVADQVGLSAVLTVVCYAITLQRSTRLRLDARMRLSTNAVWSTAVFALNIFAFIFIGLQIRPIVGTLTQSALAGYLGFTCAVLATVIAARLLWYMSFNAALRWHDRRFGFQPPRPMLRPSVGSGIVISWAGMRGIVTLAAAMALPAGFPQRDLVVFTAFGLTLGTLVVQGLTLKPLLRALRLDDDDPVSHEAVAGRERAYRAGLAWLDADPSPEADYVRQRFRALLASGERADGDPASACLAARQGALYAEALQAARAALQTMRDEEAIGDDAFHHVELELDWLEMALAQTHGEGSRA